MYLLPLSCHFYFFLIFNLLLYYLRGEINVYINSNGAHLIVNPWRTAIQIHQMNFATYTQRSLDFKATQQEISGK